MNADWSKVPGGPPAPMAAWLKATLIVIGVMAMIGVLAVAVLSEDDPANDRRDVRAGAARPTATPRSTYNVVYRVTTLRPSHPISLTYENETGNTEQLETRTNRQNLWTKRFEVARGEFLYVSVQNRAETGSVECEILIDGIVVEQAESQGAYVIATCSGSAPR